MPSPPLYSEPVSSGDDDSTVWRKFCRAKQQAGGASPENLSAPVLSDDTPDEGTNVSVSNGTWSGSPTSFTYQWFLEGAVQSETSNTFAIPSSAGGQEVYSVVTAYNSSGPTSAQSNVGLIQGDPILDIPGLQVYYASWKADSALNPDGDPPAELDEIEKWVDFSGNGNAVSQANASQRGLWMNGVLPSGKASAWMDDVDDGYSTGFSFGTEYTLCLVAQAFTSTAGGQRMLNSESQNNIIHFGNTSFAVFVSGILPVTNIGLTGQFAIGIFRVSATTSNFRLNGVDITDDPTVAPAWLDLSIGAVGLVPQVFDGYFSGMICFNRAVTDAEAEIIEAEVASQTGIVI